MKGHLHGRLMIRQAEIQVHIRAHGAVAAKTISGGDLETRYKIIGANILLSFFPISCL
jgi:hypothetical protein